MLNFLKPKKKFILTEAVKKRIDKELDLLSSLKDGMFHKSKEFEIGFYINIIIDKRILGMEINSDEKGVPDFLTFLIIVDSSFPEKPPKILTKTNFSFPSLMDGRDLMPDVYPEWTQDRNILDIANALPKFVSTVLNSKIYHFYGIFHIGAIYDLKNFNNMLVNNFNCTFEKNQGKEVQMSENSNLTLILSDDCFILFENLQNNQSTGKIIFWSTLYGISDLQVNKMQKIASLNFYNDETNQEKQIRLNIENILFFREALVKRMSALKVKVEAKKLIKGQQQERRLTNREINTMNIKQVVQQIENLKQKLDNNDLNYYNVNTFTILCGKAIEYYSAMGDESHMKYLNIMKDVLSREDIQKITNEDTN